MVLIEKAAFDWVIPIKRAVQQKQPQRLLVIILLRPDCYLQWWNFNDRVESTITQRIALPITIIGNGQASPVRG